MMVTSDMVDAYISAYLWRNGRDGVASGIEAALSAEAFGLRDAIAQTKEIYEESSEVKDALDYLEQLLERSGA